MSRIIRPNKKQKKEIAERFAEIEDLVDLLDIRNEAVNDEQYEIAAIVQKEIDKRLDKQKKEYYG